MPKPPKTPLLLAAATALVLAAGTGCADYAHHRRTVDELDHRDTGLQSKDVVNATDSLAADLLADPELNRSRTQWTIVVDRVENKTTEHNFDYDIFTERLRVKLAQLGRGRVTLIENKAKTQDIRSRELDERAPAATGDEYGQGGRRPAQGGATAYTPVQPDYALYGRIINLPNRGTDYYLCEFTVTDLHTRVQVWSNAYEVKVAR